MSTLDTSTKTDKAAYSPAPFSISERITCRAVVDANGNDIVYLDIMPRFYNGEPCGSMTSRGRTPEELLATAFLFEDAPAMDLLLKLLQSGKAAFDPDTKEFRFNGLRYSGRDGDWSSLLNVIGWDKARKAVS